MAALDYSALALLELLKSAVDDTDSETGNARCEGDGDRLG